MKINMENKTINASRNLVFGILLKIYQLIMPFIIRTIIIRVLGIEYAGLNSLFVSILQVLNIAELGVGSALVFSMYRPIAENDKEKICALMNLYKYYYRIIGFVILCIGISITPFLDKLINGDVPKEINIIYIYYLNLIATVSSYWLFAYKNSLFQAHQRNDIISKITIVTNTLMYSFQIVFLIQFKNYYMYVIIIILMQVLNNIVIAINADKKFPEYKPIGKLDKEEKRQINLSIKDLFYSQLGLIITTSVDSIVISAFLGLIPLAIFQNYYYIINALIGFFTIFYQSCRASIGTNLITKSIEDNYNDFKFITFIIIGVLSFCVSCLINLYQPFITIWVGKENLLDTICVYLFAIYFFVYELAFLLESYKNASGKWHEDRFRPLITALINLTTNIILVQFIGIYGILLSTIGSYVIINIPWLYRRLFIDAFKKELQSTYTKFICKKFFEFILIVFVNIILCSIIKVNNLYIKIIINFSICFIFTSIIYILFNRKESEYKKILFLLSKISKKFK